MKKTFSINISGIIFQMDDDAYETLKKYLDTIKSHFRHTEGHEEIISDIENRVAELLQQCLAGEKQVINMADVKRVTEAMGNPSEFEEDTEDHQAGATAAAYESRRKRLYRDTENRLIGGVAAGLGAYFSLDPIWFRLLFIILLFSGFAIPIYIILWIIVPAAVTTAEKLEMRGEPVTVENIERSIRDEMEHLKDKLNDLSKQAGNGFKKKSSGLGDFIERLFRLIFFLLKGLLKVVVIFAGIIFLIIGFGLVIALIAASFGIGSVVFNEGLAIQGMPIWVLIDRLMGGVEGLGWLQFGVFLLLGIPVVMLLYGAVRMIFGLDRVRYIGLSAFYLWIIGLVLVLYYSFTLGQEFRIPSWEKEAILLDQNEQKHLNISLDIHAVDDARIIEWAYFHNYRMGMDPELKYIFIRPRFSIQPSSSERAELWIYRSARGKSGAIASKIASQIPYELMVKDSSIVLPPYFQLDEGSAWRVQILSMELRLPEGWSVTLAENLTEIWDEREFWQKHHLPGNIWQMDEKGLKEKPNASVTGMRETGFEIYSEPELLYPQTLFALAPVNCMVKY